MAWKKWKFCAFISCLIGVAQTLAAGAIVPTMTLKESFLVCGTNIAINFLLFIKQHPAEEVSFDTSTITKQQKDNANEKVN